MARKPKPSGQPRLRDHGRPLGNRAVDRRPERLRFLIVCEGAKTEPNYFRRFRVNARIIDLRVVGAGTHTLDLVEQAYELMQQERYDHTWCVLDRDSFPAGRFNDALDLAERREINVAYSNEAFELWYLLHFGFHDTAVSRTLYKRMLGGCLGKPYRKNARDMYDLLLELQPQAISNAERLLASYGPDHRPERDNPCTTVHLLVQELNRHIR